MKRVLFLLVLFVAFACQKKETMEEKYDGYAVTGEAYDITTSTAVITGEIFPSKKDMTTVFGVGFYVEGRFGTPLSDGFRGIRVFEKTGGDLELNGKFEYKLTGLKSGTTYWYTAVYSAPYGRSGKRMSFTTKNIEVSVITDEMTDINLLGATLHGHFLSDVYYKVTKVWFVLGDPGSTDRTLDSTFGKDGRFSTVVSNLVGREYTVTAWAELYDGTKIHGETIPLSLPEFSETVDLGLSVKWRNWNVGADAIYKLGDYFAWGETAPKEEYTFANYTNADGDAAAAILGDGWRMPTIEEWKELADPDNCTWSWIELLASVHGSDMVRGFKVEGKNGNWILLPAYTYWANGNLLRTETNSFYGGYWSSTPDNTRTIDMLPAALSMFIGINEPYHPAEYVVGSSERFNGLYVRAVKK